MEFLKSIDFDIAALILLIMIYMFVAVQYSNKSKTDFAFKRLVIALIIYTLLDVFSAYALEHSATISKIILYNAVSWFFFFELNAILYYNNYVESVLVENRAVNKKYVIRNFGPALILIILLLVNIFWPIMFEVDADGNMIYYPLYHINYLLSLYYYGGNLYVIIAKRTRITTQQVISLVMYVTMALLGSVMEILLGRDKLILAFFLSLATLQMMISLETPNYQKLKDIITELDEVRSLTDETVRKKNRYSANLECEIKRDTERVLQINNEILTGTQSTEVKEITQNIIQTVGTILPPNE